MSDTCPNCGLTDPSPNICNDWWHHGYEAGVAAGRKRCVEIIRELGRSHYGTNNANITIRAIESENDLDDFVGTDVMAKVWRKGKAVRVRAHVVWKSPQGWGEYIIRLYKKNGDLYARTQWAQRADFTRIKSEEDTI